MLLQRIRIVGQFVPMFFFCSCAGECRAAKKGLPLRTIPLTEIQICYCPLTMNFCVETLSPTVMRTK
jgi:hypothetical protein